MPRLSTWFVRAALVAAPRGAFAAQAQPDTTQVPRAAAHEGGEANLVLIGQPGAGKTVALAHLASLAANRSEKLGQLQDHIPFLLHVADLKLPIHDQKDVLNPINEVSDAYAPVFEIPSRTGMQSCGNRSRR